MKVSIVVAAAENNVIGRENGLIWKLSNDMKYFKGLTMGHPVIMGRKTFESIGKPLPGRKNIVITRNQDFTAEGCVVVHTIESALAEAKDAGEVFVIGGDNIYRQFWGIADKLYLTRVHTKVSGDAAIPTVDESDWTEESRQFYKADEKNEHDHSIITYARK